MSFRDALKVEAGTVERPPILPMGYYRASVKEASISEKSFESGPVEILTVKFNVIEADETVDADALEAFGSLENCVRGLDFIYPLEGDPAQQKRVMYRIQQFLMNHLGLEEYSDMLEAIATNVGAECLIQIGHRQDKNDSEVFYDQIKSTAALD